MRIRLKLGLFGGQKQKDKVEKFLRVTSRLIEEYSIPLIDYDDWDDFEVNHPELKSSCEWDSQFLYLASPKFQTKVTALMKEKRKT